MEYLEIISIVFWVRQGRQGRRSSHSGVRIILELGEIGMCLLKRNERIAAFTHKTYVERETLYGRNDIRSLCHGADRSKEKSCPT